MATIHRKRRAEGEHMPYEVVVGVSRKHDNDRLRCFRYVEMDPREDRTSVGL